MRAILQITLIALAACASEPIVEESPTPPPPKAPEITVGLASTRLGADCGEGRPATPSPPPAKKPKSRAAIKPEAKTATDPHSRIPCEQTAVHLSIRSSASASATTMKVKHVELLDKNGKLIEVLTAGSPSRWGTDRFVAWDESIVPGQTMAVGYKLSSPDWSKIPNANNRSFKMRITVTVGNSDRTFEATAELRIEDTSGVVT